MRLWIEIPLFAALAAGLHLALFAGLHGGAPEAAGDEGEATLTLAGASGDVEAMVAAWEAPPPVISETVAMTAPEEPAEEGSRPVKDRAPRRAAPAPLAPSSTAGARPDLPDAPEPVAQPEVSSAGPQPASVAETDTSQKVPNPSAAPPRQAPPASPSAPMATTQPQVQAPPLPKTRPQARPEQTAAGSGATGARGTRAEAPPGLSDSARRSIVASWGAEIRARVEARKVPPAGLRATGRPVVRITVARSGALEDVRVVQSSQVAAVDEAALRAVRRAGRFPAAPEALDLARVSFDLPIAFTR